MIIIAFAGLARGGKTTAANAVHRFCTEHDMDPVICSFAAPMKKAAERLGIDKERNPTLYRTTLQRWGETRRDPKFRPGRSGPDYWVNRIIQDLFKMQKDERAHHALLDELGLLEHFKEKVVIFDDMRYLNELNIIKLIGGTTIFVDGAKRLTDVTASWRLHESEEMAMQYTFGDMEDCFDYYITNNAPEVVFNAFVQDITPLWLDMEIMT